MICHFSVSIFFLSRLSLCGAAPEPFDVVLPVSSTIRMDGARTAGSLSVANPPFIPAQNRLQASPACDILRPGFFQSSFLCYFEL